MLWEECCKTLVKRNFSTDLWTLTAITSLLHLGNWWCCKKKVSKDCLNCSILIVVFSETVAKTKNMQMTSSVCC